MKNKIISSLTLNHMGEIIRLTVLSYFKNNNIIYLFTNFILDGIIFLWKIDISPFIFRKKKAYIWKIDLEKKFIYLSFKRTFIF